MIEIWKPVKNYEGYYEISNLGTVRSLERTVKQGKRFIFIKAAIKNHYISKKGYPVVTLCKNGKSVGKYLHVLLAEAFIPNPDNKPFVDHINTNKMDYTLDNLKWVTSKENSNNKITKTHLKEAATNKEGIIKRLITRKNKITKTSPKTIYQFTEDKIFIKSYLSIADAARSIGVSPSYLRKKLNNSPLKGFLWTDNYEENLIGSPQ